MQEDSDFKAWVEKEGGNIRQCPDCHVRIQKNNGCDHMHCRRCGRHFQWGEGLRLSKTTEQENADKRLAHKFASHGVTVGGRVAMKWSHWTPSLEGTVTRIGDHLASILFDDGSRRAYTVSQYLRKIALRHHVTQVRSNKGFIAPLCFALAGILVILGYYPFHWWCVQLCAATTFSFIFFGNESSFVTLVDKVHFACARGTRRQQHHHHHHRHRHHQQQQQQQHMPDERRRQDAVVGNKWGVTEFMEFICLCTLLVVTSPLLLPFLEASFMAGTSMVLSMAKFAIGFGIGLHVDVILLTCVQVGLEMCTFPLNMYTYNLRTAVNMFIIDVHRVYRYNKNKI